MEWEVETYLNVILSTGTFIRAAWKKWEQHVTVEYTVFWQMTEALIGNEKSMLKSSCSGVDLQEEIILVPTSTIYNSSEFDYFASWIKSNHTVYKLRGWSVYQWNYKQEEDGSNI